MNKLLWTVILALCLGTFGMTGPTFAKTGKGSVCAWFTGTREVGAIHTWYQPYTASRCFTSMASCKSWLYKVQTAYPLFMDFRPCKAR
ncbi:MAG: hypothetical protein J0H63_05255 [Rhizobiales bacterium]|jgi:hypothetical protein|nr:hypothetical protein [Hyphomicrobiales bacterium]MBN9009556.1 hypothetical protein [Hyphomicrobiales bacterium]